MKDLLERLKKMERAVNALCKVISDRAEDTERIDWMEAFPQEFGRIDAGKFATWREAIDAARE